MEDLIDVIHEAWQEYCKKSYNNRPKYILMHWKIYQRLITQDEDMKTIYYDTEHTHFIIFGMEIQYDRRMEKDTLVFSRTNLLDLQQSIRGCGDAISLVLDENKEEGEDYGK